MVVLECKKQNKSHENCLPKFFEEKKPSQELLFFINVLEELLINCILHNTSIRLPTSTYT